VWHCLKAPSTPVHEKRAAKVEWEHAVPAENFGRVFVEWREGDALCASKNGKPFKGRRCAEKVSMKYRYMRADMYNLFPAIGAMNAVRNNRQYTEGVFYENKMHYFLLRFYFCQLPCNAHTWKALSLGSIHRCQKK